MRFVDIGRGIFPAGLSLLAAAMIAAAPSPAMATIETLSAPDQALYGAAFALVNRERWREARALADRADNPLPAKVIQWLDLTRPGPGRAFSEITAFMRDNPDWPGQETLQQQGERAMPPNLPPAQVIAWFQAREPLTLEGGHRLAAAVAAAGSKEASITLARRAWRELDAGSDQARSAFLRTFGEHLSKQDHVARLDLALWENNQGAARDLMQKVDAGHRALAEARLALRGNRGKIDKLIDAVPKELQSDPGLIYERARWRRRKDQLDDIAELFAPALTANPRPDLMWQELDPAARHALASGKAALAYSLAVQHGATSGTEFAEGEWLAGWIALRFLKDPAKAMQHFTRLHAGVAAAISKARAAYWAGRTADALNQPAVAQRWYGDAARWTTTYYGQLAAERLGRGTLTLPATAKPTDAARQAFVRKEMVRIVRLLGRINEADRAKPFLNRLIELSKDPAEHFLVVELAASLGRNDLMVQTAKTARQAGTEIVEYLYPMRQLPAGDKPEPALILGVIRQESAFDPNAVSPAGARGLMQLMPATAKSVARQLRLKYAKAKLTADPGFNVALGREYLGDLIDSYDGSYVLAIAAYNAGPGRVREFLARNRDPRRDGVDVIDWIESIPLPETRNYVQRVLENLQVYRHRLGGTQLALSLKHDLAR